MTKKSTKPCIKFIGHNATEVTGSANLVKFLDYELLVDYGLRQTSNDVEDYKINSKRHKDIKPKNLNAIILTHSHIDHSGLIPALFKEGANCPVYVPIGCKKILTFLWQDTTHIFTKDYERFERPIIYTQNDVDLALSHIVECELHKEIKVNEYISFTYYNARHVVRSCQVYMELNDGVGIKKIGFTGDFSIKSPSFYLDDVDYLPFVDALVGECTYSNKTRVHKLRDRNKDIEKLKYSIDKALTSKGKILIPVFSMDRLQNILTTLYTIYDGKPPIPILVDTPLGKNICSIWRYVIDKNFDLWEEVYECPYIRWTTDFKDSIAYSKIDEPMLVIAGGGFLNGGRATFWSQELLPHKKHNLVFCGYSSPESVAGMIKSGALKEVKIDGKIIKNNARITILNSFSSHADYEELMEYYTKVKYNKLVLVHSNFDDKISFSKELANRLSKANRTSRVIASNIDTKIFI